MDKEKNQNQNILNEVTDDCLTIHQLISKQSQIVPEKTAVVFENTGLTYLELESRSNQLAHYLRTIGVQTGQFVGLYVERSLEMIVGLLGILKAGGAYLPLDPAYPANRIGYMIADSGSKFILTQNALRDSLPEIQATILCLDSDYALIAQASDSSLPPLVQPEDLAYLIYTSGSTGRPKGVEISHQAVVNFLCSMREAPGFEQHDRLLAVTTLSFDIAGLELYLPLIVGGQVIIATRSTASDGSQLTQKISSSQPTVMQATPATWRLLLEANWKGDPQLRILCGGETLTRELADRLLPKCKELWNMYGPTEATIWSTIHRVESGTGSVPIGYPIANTEIQILNEKNLPVPVGEPGELFIGGKGLARGYFNRPELTDERFIPHPIDKTSETRLYRTGDLAKYLPNGSLEHLGRVDFQVKVRGFRIELGEIEAALDKLSTIQQSVVLAREDVPGEKRLVAYCVPNKGQQSSSKDLRKELSTILPDYMIPGIYVSLESFPLTPNGKVDRKALPAPDSQRPELAVDYLAPRTQEETQLCEIWAEVLRVEKVGVHDNFFELGGDSLKVAQVATRVREVFSVDMFLRSVFEHPTVEGLVPIILAADPRQDVTEELSITQVTRGEYIPLSFSQERVWFLHQINPQNLAYNFHCSIEFRGQLDIQALEQSLDEILRRHESFRTSFPTVNGRPEQVVHPYTKFSLPIIDLSGKSPADQELSAKSWCDEEFQFRFDLGKIPLVRWTLLRYSDEKNVLMHMEHHFVHDGWSFNVFLRELVDLYRAFVEDRPSPLPELPVQFAEFTTWQHQWMRGEVSDYQLAYWKKKFQTIPPVLELPTKGPRPTTQSFRGTSLRPEIPLELCNQLRELSRKEGSTLFMTMLAGFIALLHRYTGETDVAVGTFFANRRSRESESLIGMILNNVVIRTALENNPTVRELLRQVRDVVLEGSAYQDVPFDRVVEAVQPKRDLSMNPLFHIMFSFHDEPMPEEGLPGLDVKLTPVLSNGSAKFDLGVIGIPHSAQNLGLPQGSDQDGLTMIWEHNTDLFQTSTIARMIEHYKSLLASMVENPEMHISDLRLVSEEESQKLLLQANDTEMTTARDLCLHQLIEVQAGKTPNRVAIQDASEEMTYLELNTRANQLANHLRGLGVGPNILVGISVERSADMVVGLLGILKAGGAYVPIDPLFPADRQQFMIEDANISYLVTKKAQESRLSEEGKTIVYLDSDRGAIAQASQEPPTDVKVTPESLAYVIFTSGSTGKPKGVQISHRSVVNFLKSMQQEPGITPEDRLFAVTTLSFDIAGLELYLPLTVGARVIVSNRKVATNGEELARQLVATEATIMQATPTTWQMLIDAGWKGKSDLTVLCGGEALPRSLAEQLLPLVKVVWNMYGPTETTIWSTIYQVKSAKGFVPIGRPIHNTQVYVLDRYGNPVPPGVRGELCIGGAGLAVGYLNRPELTADKFVQSPIAGNGDSLIYRTGDLARFRHDGTLECLGRIDHQIKLRGFRIELGEIESAMEQIEEIRQAVVVVREEVPGERRLVGYYVTSNNEITASDLRKQLKQCLPEYMVPALFVELDSLPLTPNGKIDRKSLPAPNESNVKTEETYAPPETPIQEMLSSIWKEVLSIHKIGIQDNFFDLGGHSLMVIKVLSRIQDEIGVLISIETLFQNPTIQELEEKIVEAQLSQIGSEDIESLLEELER